MDALAKDGMMFTDAHTNSAVCTPTRYGILTGTYAFRTRLKSGVLWGSSPTLINKGEATVASLLRKNGYNTAVIGKWHLGWGWVAKAGKKLNRNSWNDKECENVDFTKPLTECPNDNGFDYYFGIGSSNNMQPYCYIENNKIVVPPATKKKRPVYDTESGAGLVSDDYVSENIDQVLWGKAKGWLDRHFKTTPKKPFFLYMPHTMLHKPLGVSEAFRGKSKFGLYGDVIQELDHHVGRLMDALKRLGLDRNTMVVYASDNGRGPGRTPAQPLRGHKLSTYEAGIRVPCIAWGPGLGVRAKHTCSEVVSAMDWYPTLATLAGAKVPKGRVIDGRDISPLLNKRCDKIPRLTDKLSLNAAVPLRRTWDPPGEWKDLITRQEYHDAFFYHGSHGALAAVRWGKWKLYINPDLQLFDLDKDPGERKTVRNAKIARKLRGMVIMFQNEMRTDARPAGRQEK